MKIALIAPSIISNKVKEIAQEFDDIELLDLQYNDYKDSVDIIKNCKENYDAIVFGGKSAYSYSQHYLEENCIWDYFPRHVLSFSSALLNASFLGYDLTCISCDTFSESLIREAYAELPFNYNKVSVSLIPDEQLTIQDEIRQEKYNQDVLNFHKKNYEKNKKTCIISALHTVQKKLNEQGITCFTAYPTRSVIRDTLSKLYLKYQAKQNQKSKIIVLSIEIDLPSEYYIISAEEYNYAHKKMPVVEMIYKFAQDIKAAVVEASYNTFLLFSTKSMLETKTDNFEKISLLDEIDKNSLHVLSIGIGYGSTAQDAKYNANLGMIKAKQHSKNTAYVIYEDKKIKGPITPTYTNKKPENSLIDKKLYLISDTSGVNINTVFKLYNIVNKYQKNHFTSKELADECNLSTRSINEIINKLEPYGYCQIVGKKYTSNTGRPSRIVQFNF